MSLPLGDFPTGATIDFKWSTFALAGASVTRSTNGTLLVYKGSSTTERSSAAGITETEDFDSKTGVHHVTIVLSDNTDAGFYAAGNEYQVVMTGMVVDTQTLNVPIAHFSIERAGGTLALLKTIISGAGVNVTQLGGVTQSLTDLKDFADDGYDPTTNKVQGVVLTDTTTTYTGNTPQTGDNFPRIGATGTGLTSLASAADLATLAAYVDTEVAAILAAVDTEIAAMKAIIDLLPNGGALTSLASAASIVTLQAFVDTEVAAILAAAVAIQAVTDLLPNGGSLNDVSPTDIENAVWNATMASHLTAGSTGASLNGAGSVGDPWTTALPGAYGPGTAGAIIGTVSTILAAVDTEVAAIKAVTDLLPNGGALTSLATAASLVTLQAFVDTEVASILAAVDTEVAAIKAKTDALPTDPADESSLQAAIATRATPVQVATELATMLAAARAELTDVPAANAGLAAQIQWVFLMLSNPMLLTATLQTLRNRANTSTIGTAIASNDGITTTREAFL